MLGDPFSPTRTSFMGGLKTAIVKEEICVKIITGSGSPPPPPPPPPPLSFARRSPHASIRAWSARNRVVDNDPVLARPLSLRQAACRASAFSPLAQDIDLFPIFCLFIALQDRW